MIIYTGKQVREVFDRTWDSGYEPAIKNVTKWLEENTSLFDYYTKEKFIEIMNNQKE